ncbi:hypothetical protein [Streptomyces sp. NPDC086777]|uniref:hypothetical protein n=1 Tax=Streptomyces sp. NPDC086777 TaxID=3154866 RepID=UPI00344FF091
MLLLRLPDDVTSVHGLPADRAAAPLGRPYDVLAAVARAVPKANLTRHSLDQLTALVETRPKLMQYRPRLIEGLTARTGLDLQPRQPQPVKIF